MEDYEDFSEHNEQMTDEEQTVPVSGGEAEPAAVDAADAADTAAAPQTPARTEETYAPGEVRGAYADAGYIPAADAGAMPKSYHCAASEPRAKKEKPRRAGMRPAAVVALCLVCALIGGMACGLAPRWIKSASAAPTEETEISRSAPAEQSAGTDDNAGAVLTRTDGSNAKTVTTNKVSGSEMSPTDIYYNLALDQVVGVRTEVTYTNYFGYTTKAAVNGSGFIISENGYILTNYHVVEEAISGGLDVEVLTHDGETYVATVVGFDEDHDVALLKIDATGLNAAVLGDSDAMLVGEQVYAVGNPTGELEYSMTEGIVSAKDREITAANSSTGRTETIGVFQTTAAINGGNSGGPIYNSRGEVIGIVVAKKVSTELEGLAFAIPINDAARIAEDLISDGYVRGKAYMGVHIGTVTAAAAQYYGLVQGAIVAGVEEGSCAETAGLQESDIIVAMDGKEITSREDLVAAKKSYSAGDSAVLKVYRDKQYLELTITFDEETPELLSADDDEVPAPTQEPQQSASGYDEFFRDIFGGSPFGR